MIGILLHVVVTTALFYLGSRAEVTRWLWSRYPRPLARLLDCSSCSGFWYGLGATAAAEALGERTLPVAAPAIWVIGPFLGMVGTPMLAYLHQEAMMRLGSAVADDA